MTPKAGPSRRPGAERTPKRRVRSTETEPLRDLGEEVERPLDAEDIALASLEAQVRAKEARADLGSIESEGTVTLRLSRAMMMRIEAEARRRGVTQSELMMRALTQYLSK